MQPQNNDTLCDAIFDMVQQHCPILLQDTTDITDKLNLLFAKLEKCHMIYDKGIINDKDITNLCKDEIKIVYNYCYSLLQHVFFCTYS